MLYVIWNFIIKYGANNVSDILYDIYNGCLSIIINIISNKKNKKLKNDIYKIF